MSFMLFLVPGLLLLAALAYARHHAAVAVLAALLPAYLVRFSLFGLVPTTALEAAIVLTALAGAASRSTRAQWGYAWRRLPAGVIVLVLLFLIAAVLGVVVSPHGRTSLGVLKGWILSPLLLGWLIFAAGEHAKTRRAIQSSLLFSAATMALIGLGQIQALPRVQGLYDAPNSLALFLVPLTILAWWQKKIFIALLLAVAVLATQSAAGIGALAAAALVGGIFWPSKAGSKRWSAIALLLLLAAAYFTSTGRLVYLTRSLREGVPNSTTVRRQLWSISLELIREHPLAGVGLGAFEPAYQQKLHQRFANYKLQTTNYKLRPPLPEFVFRDPHNWPLSLWLNTGLLGLASFAGINGYILWRALSASDTSLETQALALAVISLLAFGLADTIFWKNDLAALHWVLLALLLNKARVNAVQNDPSKESQGNAN